MSAEQRENLEAILRQSAFPAGADVGEQRRLLKELTLAGATMDTKRAVDVLMSRELLGTGQATTRRDTTPRWA